MHMYYEKVNIVFLYLMQHLDTSGTSKHYFKNQKACKCLCTISSCAHNGCTCPAGLAVSASGNLGYGFDLAASCLALRLTGKTRTGRGRARIM